MILKNIRLDNIRSYVSENIQFPQGSMMLSGDIGSGKSTILLATEFALFGIRSDLKGESLLRHGKDKGSVELQFSVQGKDITIKRGLKRTNKSVQQDTGFILKDGIKKELTAVELKTHIIDLLGYPKDLVSKSKSLVYRYTVYTPQEQMKQILFDEKDERLNTLRRVFSIDKYSRIIDNTSIITKKMKMSIKELEGSILDLEEKKRLAAERRSELSAVEESLKNTLPLLENARTSLRSVSLSIEKYEKDIKELNELKTRLSVNESRLRERANQHQANAKEADQIEIQIKALLEPGNQQAQLKKHDPESINNLKSKKEALEKELNELRIAVNEIEIRSRNSVAVVEKISSLSSCPTCEQDVSDTHKNNILAREKKIQEECRADLENMKPKLPEKQKEISEIITEIDRLKEENQRFENNRIQMESRAKMIEDKIKRKEALMQAQDQIKKDIAAINEEKIAINSRMSPLASSEENYLKEKKLLDELKDKEKSIEIRKASLEKEGEGIRRTITSFEKEIEQKQRSRQKISDLKQRQEWIEKSFVGLMGMIEKHVMVKIYSEFDELFRQWFRIMIDDEALSVSLDHDFTPVVHQDGYETTLEHLSGGEKTSVALAYRLSLNKVINDIIGSIKTKDIIILDEPTDGFSSEQLDKVREVIEELDMNQIILVSHEPKVESFVDNILRVEKRGHVSRITS